MNGDVDWVVMVGAIESELNSSIVRLLVFECHNGSLTCFLTSVRPVLALIVDMTLERVGELSSRLARYEPISRLRRKVYISWITGLEVVRIRKPSYERRSGR